MEKASRARHDAEAAAEAQGMAQRAARVLSEAEATRRRFDDRRAVLVNRAQEVAEESHGVTAQLAQRESSRMPMATWPTPSDAGRCPGRRARALLWRTPRPPRAGRLMEREARLAAERATHAERLDALAREVEELTQADHELARRQAEARLALDSRRASLTDVETRLANTEERVRTAGESLVEAEHALDAARREATASAEALHHAELEHRDLASRQSLIRERLEAEWRRPLAELYAGHEPVQLRGRSAAR